MEQIGEEYTCMKDFLVVAIAKEMGPNVDEGMRLLKRVNLKEYLFVKKMWEAAQLSYEEKDFTKALDYLEYWYAHLSVQNIQIKKRELL